MSKTRHYHHEDLDTERSRRESEEHRLRMRAHAEHQAAKRLRQAAFERKRSEDTEGGSCD